MLIAAVTNVFTGFIQKFLFGIVGENITLNMRFELYRGILKKHIGFFDQRENSPGVLTSVLASEAQVLNGASTEGGAVMVECFFALVCGVFLGFYYSWRLALVALGSMPFMIAAGYIGAKFQAGFNELDE